MKKWLIGLVPLILISFYLLNNKRHTITIGKYPLTVQLISDIPGFVEIYQNQDTLILKGQTISNDSSGFLYIDGTLSEIQTDSFKLSGIIDVKSIEQCCGRVTKKGNWTFRRTENRDFYRLKERDELCPCDKCCYYIDIHLK